MKDLVALVKTMNAKKQPAQINQTRELTPEEMTIFMDPTLTRIQKAEQLKKSISWIYQKRRDLQLNSPSVRTPTAQELEALSDSRKSVHQLSKDLNASRKWVRKHRRELL